MIKKIVIIDGQGGKIGSMLLQSLKVFDNDCKFYAIGTNSFATAAMIKSGADYGATGENPVIVNCIDADIIAGSDGILISNSFLGEVTPNMAVAVNQSKAYKVLLPISHSNNYVVGVSNYTIPELITQATITIINKIKNN